MKILFCLFTMSVGGLEVLTVNLAERLIARGHEVGILIFRNSGKGLDFISERKIKFFFAKRRDKFNPFFLLNIYKAIKYFKPEIILSLSDFIYFFVELMKKIYNPRIPHGIAFHSPTPLRVRFLKQKALGKLFVFLSKLSEAYYVFVANSQSREYQEYYRLPKDKIFMIYNGIDIKFFNPVKKKKDNSFTIIHIANIWLRKDQWTLLKSLTLLNRDFGKWRLIFVGEEREGLLDQLKAYLRSKGLLNKVDFVPGADRESIKRLLSKADLFVLSSIYEVLPVAALEAMAAGLPCVLTKVGGCSEIVEDGYNGYLVEPRDEEALADRLRYLSRNPALLKQMGKKARETAEEKFNLDKSVEDYLRIFRTVRI